MPRFTRNRVFVPEIPPLLPRSSYFVDPVLFSVVACAAYVRFEPPVSALLSPRETATRGRATLDQSFY